MVLLCGHALPTLAQTEPTPTRQTPAPLPVAISPAQPEVQPDLSLDRDPVLSPDADDNLPINAQGISSTGRSRDLQKDQKGVFTLQENVNEVLLNCTVLDQKGRLVLI